MGVATWLEVVAMALEVAVVATRVTYMKEVLAEVKVANAAKGQRGIKLPITNVRVAG